MSGHEEKEKNENPAGASSEETQKKEDILEGTGRKIIVVEDDPTTRSIIESLLKKRGYDVLLTTNGKEALSQISPDALPHLIITDALMPEMDGYHFLKEIKANNAFQKIPILILTARKNMEDSFLVVGADDFCTKPIDSAEFLKKIAALSIPK